MVDISWSEIKMKAEGLGGGRREEEDVKETMTDGHWRRGDRRGDKVGVGGRWRHFKAPAKE